MKVLCDSSFVLGIQIHRISRVILGVSQKCYNEKDFKRYGTQDFKPTDTHVSKGDKFSLKQCHKKNLRKQKYRRFPMHMQWRV